MPTPENTRPVHHLARLSYLQSLFVHRRVLIVSDDRTLASFMLEARARYVCAISDRESSEPWPSDEEGQGGEFKVVSYDDIEFRDGMFDVAVVMDLTAVSSHVNLLNELRRIVGPKGVVIAGAPNPICEQRIGPDPDAPAIDYYELYEILADAFPSVQMIGQAPFLGYAVSDLAAGEDSDGVSFDAGLMESGAEDIEWFMAVCGESPVEIESYSIIQVPLDTIQMGGGLAGELEDARREVSELGADLKDVRLEMGTRGVKIESLQKDLEHECQEAEAARARAVNVAKQFDDDRKAQQGRQIEEQIARQGAQNEIKEQARKAQNEIKEQARKAQDEARQARMRAESAEVARDQLVEQTRADLAELEKLRDRQEELERALSDHQEKERDLTEQLAQSREQSSEAQEAKAALSALEDSAQKDRAMFEGEVVALEKQLTQVGGDLRVAREDLTRHEALARDLAVQLDERASIETEKEALDREILDRKTALAQRDGKIAELEAELQAAGWRADELEARGQEKDRELEEAGASLSAKEDELAAAFGAISGHHRARVEAELALATTEASHTKTEKELDKFIEHSRELEAEFAAVAGACSGHHRARVEAELALATTEASHTQTEKELDKFIEHSRELEAEFAAVTGACSGHHRARVEAELELATAQARHEQTEKELDEFIERARNAEESFTGEKARSSDELTFLENEKASLENEKTFLENEKTSLENELNSMGNQLVSLGNELVSLENELAADREKVRNLEPYKSKVEELNSEIMSGAKLRASMENNLADLDDKLIEKDTQLTRAKQLVDELEYRAAESDDALAAIRSELDGAITHAEKKSRELNEAEVRIRREVAREIAEVRADVKEGEHLQMELADVRLELNGVRAELSGEVERTRQAGADAARLAGENDDMKARLDERERKLNNCADEAAAGERALLAMRDEVSALGKQMTAMREALRAEQVRSRSLLAEVDRLGELEDKSGDIDREREEQAADIDREREENAARIRQLESNIESVEASVEAGQTQLKEHIAEANARANERAGQYEQRIQSLLEEIEIEKEKAAKSALDEAAATELVQIRLTSAKQAETIRRLTDESKEREPLLESLTSQLEERERRVTMMERKTRQIEAQLKEHEGDTAAWNTELKFRNTRITQLEKEISGLKDQLTEEPSSGQSADEGASVPPSQSLRQSEIPAEVAAIKHQVSDLNEQLGDKDAELLILHGKLETENRDLERTRQALKDMLASGGIESGTAVHINDILSALNRK